MRKSLSISVIAVLFACGAAFSANGSAYYNVFDLSGTLYLTQDAAPCTSPDWKFFFPPTVINQFGTTYVSDGYGGIKPEGGVVYPLQGSEGNCLASVKDTPDNLYKILDEQWVNAATERTLFLGTDIDLGEISADQGKCTVNHKPLPYLVPTPVSSGFFGNTDVIVPFDGNGKVISNLCYEAEKMTQPVGLFESVESSTIQNVTLRNVRIVAKGSEDGADYYPVGALAGVAQNSSLENITVAEVNIVAPMAGGLVGYSYNSTIRMATVNESVSVSNEQSISAGSAGSKVKTLDVPYNEVAYNVFLGGLVGLAVRTNDGDNAKYPSVENVFDVRVDVHDYASGHNSALGGVIGLLSASAESMRNVHVVTKRKADETIPTKIWGGSAMGGLVGYVTVNYIYSSPVVGNLSFSNCSFDGEIGGAQALVSAGTVGNIALGGLIGRSNVITQMNMTIDGFAANLVVDESLKVPGEYDYYVGGVLGYGSKCGSGSSANTDFVSIVNSSTKGSISVYASGTETPNVHVKAFMGGIVGLACLSYDGNGLRNDASSMVITSNIRTAENAPSDGNGRAVLDSVFVGGIAGSVDVNSSVELVLSNLTFDGKIVVNDSLNETRIGGILGVYPEATGGKAVSFDWVKADRSIGNLIAYNANAIDKPATIAKRAVDVGGLCGNCRHVASVGYSSVKGKVSVTGVDAGDYLAVGGLAGRIVNEDSTMKMEKNFVIGDIDVKVSKPEKPDVGYLFGNGVFYGEYIIASNYFYGENSTALDAFGTICGKTGNIEDWKNGKNITYVIRNGARTDLDDENHNGTETEAVMRSAAFAGFMNTPFAKSGYAWAFSESVNDGFPFLTANPQQATVPGSLTPKYEIVFKVEGVAIGESQWLDAGESAVPPTKFTIPEGKVFVGWDSQKYLDVFENAEINAVLQDNPQEDEPLSSSSQPESSGSAPQKNYEVVQGVPQVDGRTVQVSYTVTDLDESKKSELVFYVYDYMGVVVDSAILAKGNISRIDSAWEYSAPYAGKYHTELVLNVDGQKVQGIRGSFAVVDQVRVTGRNWSMVSLGALQQQNVDLGSEASLYWWDEKNPVGDYWQYRTYNGGDVMPSQGFWYSSPEGDEFVIQVDSVDKNAEILWDLDSVYSGWNMVANPYGWAIDLTFADDNGAGVTFYQWLPEEGAYGPATHIGPYEAVWAKLGKGASATVRVPAAPYVDGGKKESSVEQKVAALRKGLRKATSQNWSVVAILSDEKGRADFWNVIGAGDEASTMDEPPAGMGDRVNLSVMEGKKALAKSVKPVAEEYQWTFSVAASSTREGKLTFDGVDELNALGLHLYVTVDGVTREVEAGEAVNVSLTKSSKEVGVRVAASAKAIAVASRIGGLRMGQSASELQLQFDASADLAGSTARYTLVGVNGKKIAAGSFTANSGSNLMTVSAPKAGVYYMHLKVGSQTTSAKVLVK